MQLSAHVVVVAIGVTPAISPRFFTGGEAPEFAEDGGICVDSRMQSSVACVLAAGDCCTVRQSHSPHWFQMRLWEQAAVMGASCDCVV
jgi:NADPH-dependent 2,4-dienoyl-CoA reductase/sulfur reductase-like enzyme